MSRNGWHLRRESGRFTVARHWPPRFDVVAEAQFPVLDPGRLARQIRQDLWRALRDLRGFSPVIDITVTETGLAVRAGGRCMRAPGDAADRIRDLLENSVRRSRWARWARVAP
ncbi:hypothetical protein KUH32_11870 [Thalassococcus sp. CAU 1522]|uniref:Uncharacterized protein n=1 Tax=Thalassococcus arenae TaxID=2851652 RepID=A0ABS6NA62_9RHOB|nr:hypothetical protein [Thalassococcus arenae]MBV2360474.1 hypothetical protein [Thalassococcus arenae]